MDNRSMSSNLVQFSSVNNPPKRITFEDENRRINNKLIKNTGKIAEKIYKSQSNYLNVYSLEEMEELYGNIFSDADQIKVGHEVDFEKFVLGVKYL